MRRKSRNILRIDGSHGVKYVCVETPENGTSKWAVYVDFYCSTGQTEMRRDLEGVMRV